ncbi:MAG: hypothetical protein ACRD6B_03470 [Bryobacteraceae bacterium]
MVDQTTMEMGVQIENVRFQPATVLVQLPGVLFPLVRHLLQRRKLKLAVARTAAQSGG